MKHSVSLALSLATFWLLNSGHTSALMLSLGAVSIILVIYISHRMDVVDHESQPVHLTLKFPAYLVWIFRQIILSNLLVVKHIWLPNKSISPTFKSIKTSQKTDMGRVIYANSITLAPGTVAVDLHGERLLVHALCRESIEGLETGEMDHRVSQLEKQC